MVEVKYGVEIEGVYNKKIHPLNRGGYHENNTGGEIPFWAVTSDSSLNLERTKFAEAQTVEFVSEAAIGKSEMLSYLEDFKNFMSKNGKYELHEVLEFNKSCGCHIHFSTWKAKENSMVTMSFYKQLRENTMSRVRKELPHLYESFRKHYFRSYSEEQKGPMINKGSRGEINYTCLSKGIEWRAFHLLDVTTWDDFFTLLKIGLEEVQKCMDNYYNLNFKEELVHEITTEEIRETLEMIKQIFKNFKEE